VKNLNPRACEKILLQEGVFPMAIQVTDLHMLRDQLMVRRQKLETVVAKNPDSKPSAPAGAS
jgi:hypothetical protein